ncbi:MAG TPA: dienelactone hydrolase family protein [Elusimicrobiota bacterium]|jgi:dienelactone hydrolase|nr:dienelactone hydrolase family protein [Elusimicrobiota bacterium]
MKTQTVEYDHGAAACKGHFAYDDAKPGKRPLVLVCHAWGGRDEFACKKAEGLAELGYAGFALDVFGGAKLVDTKEEKSAMIEPFVKDRGLLRDRLLAGLEAARKLPQVDAKRAAAIGFCFGGLCALDLARCGADLLGVVSFHGLLFAPEALPKKKVSAKVLALHGYDDPMANPDQLRSFCKEMTDAKADWQVHAYGGTMHAFTNPVANDPGFGTVYKKDADRRSWAAMRGFLDELFS